ncbi:MAG: hypothetical protein ACFB01_06145 [Cohaesibacteraceae bacterium]
MPLQNRVHASGRLEAHTARGTMMGNRGGRIHDPETQELKRGHLWASRRWISCLLAFKGRHRKVWGAGYTELFFLDEVTALSAGHRPCFECRRADAQDFQNALFDGFRGDAGWTASPGADAMDRCLHTARTGQKPTTWTAEDFPIGTMLECNKSVFAISHHGLLEWTFDGYQEPRSMPKGANWTLLTPKPIVGALRAGYRPAWHESAK